MTKILLVLFIFLSACSEKTDELVVGMELAYPPFETKNEMEEPVGVSVDIIKAFGEYINKPVRIENIAWNGLIPSLQTKKIDLIISSMTITEDRKEQVSFSDPYAQSLLGLLVNKNSGLTNYKDLNQKDRIIAVKQGTTGFFFAKEHFSNATINSFASERAAALEVSQGKADAFIYDQLTVYRNYIMDTNTYTMLAIDSALQNADWGIAVRKDDTELLKQLNEFNKEFKENGGYERITEKYLSEEKQVFDELGFEFFF